MSAPLPVRRLGSSIVVAARRPRPAPCPSVAPLLRAVGCRSIYNPFAPAKHKKTESDLSNPILDEYLAKSRQSKLANPKGDAVPQGHLSSHQSSLFLAEHELSGWSKHLAPEEQKRARRQAKQRREQADQQRDLRFSAMALDPAPLARRRLQRKLVLAGVKRFGRMTKAQKIMRTERQSLYKSHNLPTTWKKLQKVVNQIAGKTVSDALVQLRFSKKKVARDVLKGLEIARNEAIVAHGMGLGGGSKRSKQTSKRQQAAAAHAARDVWSYQAFDEKNKAKASGHPAFKPRTIELKDGSKKVVRDPTEIYIDQAWIGRAQTSVSPEIRARGRVNMLRHRTTNFSILLKEEKTRMRISDEIKKKRDNRKLWIPLPDRPVTAQRQYCLW